MRNADRIISATLRVVVRTRAMLGLCADYLGRGLCLLHYDRGQQQGGGQVMGYTVRLDGHKITYIGDYACFSCGYVDNDKSFFYERNGNLYCSLHSEEAN